jgi:CxxC-x17-CxxC domain-containing protein
MSKDKNLVCHDCQKLFLFSEAEQSFFEQKGLTNLPKRCANCRLSARYKRNGDNLDKLHKTQCVKCNALTVVPFAPDDDKPVYCKACYIEQRELKEEAATGRLAG